MERQICGWEEGRMPRSIVEDVKGTCHQAAGRFTKTAAIMAITAAFIFSGSSITVSHGAEGTHTETIRKGFSGSLAVKENPISLTEVRQEKTATLARGRMFNENIKTMAAGKYRDTYRSDNLIKAVRLCTDADSMSGKEVKQLQEAGEPVYGWFEDGIIYFYTDADTVYLNEDCSGMFRYCQALGDFSGVSGFDAGRMRDGSEMFIECSELITADSFSQWNTGNLEDMQAMFQECRWLQDITGLSNWDVSHVTNMGGLFRGGCFRSLEGLSGWDTRMVENLSGIFGECYAISDLSALSGWDTGSVTNMFIAFDGTGITDASLYPSWYSEYRPAGEGLSGAEYSMREEQREVLMATPGNAEPDNTGLIHGIASPSDAEKADGIPEADGAGIFSGSPMLP